MKGEQRVWVIALPDSETYDPTYDIGTPGGAGDMALPDSETYDPTYDLGGPDGAGDMALPDSEDASFGIEDGIYDNTDPDG
jgi:hypothetical protein